MSKTAEHLLIKLASYLAISSALVIFGIKAYSWNSTDSQSLLASLVDSLLDISSSLINLIIIRIVLLPPDHNHRFGHEKFQDLAIFSQSMFFSASGLFTLFSSIKALYLHNEVTNPASGIQGMGSCILITGVLVLYQSYVIKKTKSSIIVAERLHYFSDLLATGGVMVSMYLSEDYWWADGVCGLGISLYVIYACYSLFRQAIRNLADEEMSDYDRQQILSIIRKYPEVEGVHDFKTRFAANKAFIQLHLELDGNLSLNEAHQISERISGDLLVLFPNGEIIIHQDPAHVEEQVSYREIL